MRDAGRDLGCHMEALSKVAMMLPQRIRMRVGHSATGILLGLAVVASAAAQPASRTVPVTFTGGFEIRADDYGRPVPLYAAMLGVTPEVFRRAFSGVHPSPTHTPTIAEQQANKVALLTVLGPYGVTNAEMDTVADHYRFDSLKGQTWPHRAARAVAVVTDGTVTAIRIIDPGVGYPYPPSVSIPGFPHLKATATVAFTRNFATNGHIGSITGSTEVSVKPGTAHREGQPAVDLDTALPSPARL